MSAEAPQPQQINPEVVAATEAQAALDQAAAEAHLGEPQLNGRQQQEADEAAAREAGRADREAQRDAARETMFPKISKYLAENGDQSGPGLKEGLGLSREDIGAKYGYGSFEAFAKDAKKWQAKEDVKAAEKAEQDARDTREADYQAELDAPRKARAEGDKAVNRLVENTIRRESRKRADALYGGLVITKGGGSIKVDKDPELKHKLYKEALDKAVAETKEKLNEDTDRADAIRQAAIDRAASQGYSVGHLSPNTVQVGRNKAAEEQASLTAAALKEFYNPKKAAETEEEAPADEDVTTEDSSRPSRVTDRTFDAPDMGPRPRYSFNEDETQVDEDLDETEFDEEPRSRVGRAFRRAKNALKRLPARAGVAFTNQRMRASEYFSDEEYGKKRKGYVAGAIGAVLIAAGTYTAVKGLSGGHHPKSTGLGRDTQPHTGTLGEFNQPVNPNKVADHVDLKAGQNPWSVSADHLRQEGIPHPTDAQIWDEDLKALKQSGIPVDQATHLPVGTEIKFPKQ